MTIDELMAALESMREDFSGDMLVKIDLGNEVYVDVYHVRRSDDVFHFERTARPEQCILSPK